MIDVHQRRRFVPVDPTDVSLSNLEEDIEMQALPLDLASGDPLCSIFHLLNGMSLNQTLTGLISGNLRHHDHTSNVTTEARPEPIFKGSLPTFSSSSTSSSLSLADWINDQCPSAGLDKVISDEAVGLVCQGLADEPLSLGVRGRLQALRQLRDVISRGEISDTYRGSFAVPLVSSSTSNDNSFSSFDFHAFLEGVEHRLTELMVMHSPSSLTIKNRQLSQGNQTGKIGTLCIQGNKKEGQGDFETKETERETRKLLAGCRMGLLSDTGSNTQFGTVGCKRVFAARQHRTMLFSEHSQRRTTATTTNAKKEEKVSTQLCANCYRENAHDSQNTTTIPKRHVKITSAFFIKDKNKAAEGIGESSAPQIQLLHIPNHSFTVMEAIQKGLPSSQKVLEFLDDANQTSSVLSHESDDSSTELSSMKGLKLAIPPPTRLVVIIDVPTEAEILEDRRKWCLKWIENQLMGQKVASLAATADKRQRSEKDPHNYSDTEPSGAEDTNMNHNKVLVAENHATVGVPAKPPSTTKPSVRSSASPINSSQSPHFGLERSLVKSRRAHLQALQSSNYESSQKNSQSCSPQLLDEGTVAFQDLTPLRIIKAEIKEDGNSPTINVPSPPQQTSTQPFATDKRSKSNAWKLSDATLTVALQTNSSIPIRRTANRNILKPLSPLTSGLSNTFSGKSNVALMPPGTVPAFSADDSLSPSNSLQKAESPSAVRLFTALKPVNKEQSTDTQHDTGAPRPMWSNTADVNRAVTNLSAVLESTSVTVKRMVAVKALLQYFTDHFASKGVENSGVNPISTILQQQQRPTPSESSQSFRLLLTRHYYQLVEERLKRPPPPLPSVAPHHPLCKLYSLITEFIEVIRPSTNHIPTPHIKRERVSPPDYNNDSEVAYLHVTFPQLGHKGRISPYGCDTVGHLIQKLSLGVGATIRRMYLRIQRLTQSELRSPLGGGSQLQILKPPKEISLLPCEHVDLILPFVLQCGGIVEIKEKTLTSSRLSPERKILYELCVETHVVGNAEAYLTRSVSNAINASTPIGVVRTKPRSLEAVNTNDEENTVANPSDYIPGAASRPSPSANRPTAIMTAGAAMVLPNLRQRVEEAEKFSVSHSSGSSYNKTPRSSDASADGQILKTDSMEEETDDIEVIFGASNDGSSVQSPTAVATDRSSLLMPSNLFATAAAMAESGASDTAPLYGNSTPTKGQVVNLTPSAMVGSEPSAALSTPVISHNFQPTLPQGLEQEDEADDGTVTASGGLKFTIATAAPKLAHHPITPVRLQFDNDQDFDGSVVETRVAAPVYNKSTTPTSNSNYALSERKHLDQLSSQSLVTKSPVPHKAAPSVAVVPPQLLNGRWITPSPPQRQNSKASPQAAHFPSSPSKNNPADIPKVFVVPLPPATKSAEPPLSLVSTPLANKATIGEIASRQTHITDDAQSIVNERRNTVEMIEEKDITATVTVEKDEEDAESDDAEVSEDLETGEEGIEIEWEEAADEIATPSSLEEDDEVEEVSMEEESENGDEDQHNFSQDDNDNPNPVVSTTPPVLSPVRRFVVPPPPVTRSSSMITKPLAPTVQTNGEEMDEDDEQPKTRFKVHESASIYVTPIKPPQLPLSTSINGGINMEPNMQSPSCRVPPSASVPIPIPQQQNKSESGLRFSVSSRQASAISQPPFSPQRSQPQQPPSPASANPTPSRTPISAPRNRYAMGGSQSGVNLNTSFGDSCSTPTRGVKLWPVANSTSNPIDSTSTPRKYLPAGKGRSVSDFAFDDY